MKDTQFGLSDWLIETLVFIAITLIVGAYAVLSRNSNVALIAITLCFIMMSKAITALIKIVKGRDL